MNNALCYAAMHGHREVVDALIPRGADLNAPGFDIKATALHYAALRGQLNEGHRHLGHDTPVQTVFRAEEVKPAELTPTGELSPI